MFRASTIPDGGYRQINLVSDIPNQGLWGLISEAAEPFECEFEFFEDEIASTSPRAPMTKPTASSASSARSSPGRNDEDHEE